MMDLLRLATAGSVDDGKSTLVGRLLHDTKSVLSDQLEAIERASRARGLKQADLALLTDGLRAEREQGITIDVAYRYFATANRKFILADTPGHVQYTRNMVTGASTAQLAILLVDARLGVVEQTRRHAAVSALLAVPHVLLAVKKMDLVDFDQTIFDQVAAEFASYARSLGLPGAREIPLSALLGDNVVDRSTNMPWYGGPTLLEFLEAVPVNEDPATAPLRFPVQYVIRPRSASHPDYRGYAGQIAQGVVQVGNEVLVLPAGQRTTVVGIDTFDGPLDAAVHPQSVTLRLAEDIDVSRGDLIACVNHAIVPTKDIEATLCWLDERALHLRQRVLIRHGTRTVRALVQEIVDRFDIETLERIPQPPSLQLNEIGRARIRAAEPLPIDHYVHHRTTGSILVIDEADGATLGAGLVGEPLPKRTPRCLTAVASDVTSPHP